MKINELLTKDKINVLRENLINHFNNILEKDVDVNDVKSEDYVSNNDLSLIKDVSLSSIMVMKKKGYTTRQILTTYQNEKKDPIEKLKNQLSGLSDDVLKSMGITRI